MDPYLRKVLVWTGVRTAHVIQMAQYSTIADACDNSSKLMDCETCVTVSLDTPLSVSEKRLELFCGTLHNMQLTQFRRPIVTYPEMYLWNTVFISPLE